MHRSRLGFSYSLLSWTNPWTTANVTLLCLPASSGRSWSSQQTLNTLLTCLYRWCCCSLLLSAMLAAHYSKAFLTLGSTTSFKIAAPPGLGINELCMYLSALACSNACRQNGNKWEATLAECPESDSMHAPPHPDKHPERMQWQPAQMKLNMNQKEKQLDNSRKSSLTTQTLGKMKPMWKHICKKYGKLTTLFINKFSCDE